MQIVNMTFSFPFSSAHLSLLQVSVPLIKSGLNINEVYSLPGLQPAVIEWASFCCYFEVRYVIKKSIPSDETFFTIHNHIDLVKAHPGSLKRKYTNTAKHH